MELDKEKYKHRYAQVIVVNILLVVALIIAFVCYNNNYARRLYRQNINNVFNINQSASQITSTFFWAQRSMLENVTEYIVRHDLNYAQTLEYVNECSDTAKRSFQLIGTDYTGKLALKDETGAFIDIEYTSSDYSAMQKIFSAAGDAQARSASCTPEFTDAYSAYKSFAAYRYLRLKDEEGVPHWYTLLVVSRSDLYSDMINIDSGYKGLASMVINENGDYLLSNTKAKSNNFFDYIAVFNGLSLDEKNDLIATVSSRQYGTLAYKDYTGADSVFAYSSIRYTERWYCVSYVPVSSFHTNKLDVTFVTIIAGILLLLMSFDLLWLGRINSALKQSVKKEKSALTARSDFFTRMSHDIRTPLNVILGMCDMSLEEENAPNTTQYLQNIKESGNFLLGLVNDILDFSKIEHGKLELDLQPYPFAEFERHIHAVIVPLFQSRGISFTLVKDGIEDAVLMLDKLRVNQIVFNLLSNSAKFTPKGGCVKLICGMERCDDCNSVVRISVVDNGIGMDQDFLSHMFEAFSQEKRSVAETSSGTGLGLAIVKNLIDLMGGAIQVSSELNKGSRFDITLPAKSPADISIEPDTARSETSLDGKRILLCEDNPLNAKIAANLLSKMGVVVELAENGRVGADMFSRSAPAYYDAILMDVRMPVMDGLTASKTIRALDHPDAHSIPIVAMTANAFDEDVQKSMAAGMNAHLNKPIDPQRLCRTLCDLLCRNGHGE